MPSLHPIEIRFFPRLPRISPWSILCGLLFSALLSTSLSSYFFPFLLRPAAPDNVRGDIIETSVARDPNWNSTASPTSPGTTSPPAPPS
ncbi:hypothetical protein QBC32DRAFT_387389 [Pseudoneurospora amorphoporcata]|uniref:Uncharacterized protein n=1 Tax=Pseudoneurospora amorphoporcata TaxID=241081 RepID=A0AAN6NYZ8_9PEZI|nr:hypothetical protein QBC32DRAFT_387389 [Pseudoneurospora amorphoporcata]